jgi:PTS system glucitol/sorbitol-specific IIA component
MVKYKAHFIQIGPLVSEFVDNGILVLFGSDAPEELAEFAVLHDGKELLEPLASGDQVVIGNETFQILAVGEVANSNLDALGHLVLKFNGQMVVEMPGDVCLEAKALPPVEVGMILTIQGKQPEVGA